ncbi:GGDEF domain-containing protein [Haloimpatiens sp. FM7315]|uniref:GGDEF domain-containing protein n=1 Tax=Haloimpatiens sp. FM7315 TaxID=3298609 RepID=UPI0035A30BA2
MNKISQRIDIYMILFLLDVFCISSFVYFDLGNRTIISFIMLGFTFIIILIAYLRNLIWGLLISAFVIFFYASYQIYENVVLGKSVSSNTYVWMIGIPLSAFISGKLSECINSMQNMNRSLQNQHKELITIDKITGLSNVKGFYIDLEREMSKAKRHKNNLCLMMVKVNYYEEIYSILGEEKMKQIMKHISQCINESTRKEDSRYKLKKDILGILMTETDEKGAEVVKDRIKTAIEDLNVKIKEDYSNIKVDLKVGILEYSDEIKDSFTFKNLAEKELEYDV